MTLKLYFQISLIFRETGQISEIMTGQFQLIELTEFYPWLFFSRK